MRRHDLVSDLLDIVGTATAAAIVPILTLGRARVELRVRPDREPRLTPVRQDEGTWLVKGDLAIVIGVLFWVAVLSGIAALTGRV